MITLAMPKGRIFEEALPLLERAGICLLYTSDAADE